MNKKILAASLALGLTAGIEGYEMPVVNATSGYRKCTGKKINDQVKLDLDEN